MKIVTVTGLALLALAGCGQSESAPSEPAVPETVAAASEAVSVPVRTEKAREIVDLTPYIGKYLSDAVDGRKFLDNPAVKAAIKAAVPAAEQRAAISFDDGDLGLPIVKVERGRILAWGGAKRAEDRYNWAVVIAPDGTSPEVCIYDGLGYDDDFQSSQWFEPGRPSIMKQGKCPSDGEGYPAADIASG